MSPLSSLWIVFRPKSPAKSTERIVMGQIPAERAGTARGVLNTARQMGGSLGVAVFGIAIAAQAGFISGLRLDFGVTALLLIGAAGAALRLA